MSCQLYLGSESRQAYGCFDARRSFKILVHPDVFMPTRIIVGISVATSVRSSNVVIGDARVVSLGYSLVRSANFASVYTLGERQKVLHWFVD